MKKTKQVLGNWMVPINQIKTIYQAHRTRDHINKRINNHYIKSEMSTPNKVAENNTNVRALPTGAIPLRITIRNSLAINF
jgi:hypothetical protein